MKLETIKYDKTINPSYFKQNLKDENIDLFKKNFKRLFERINETESEEHNKNIVSDFLKNTFYKNDYEINTAGRKDLVIHKGNTSQSPVAIIIEAKSPANKNEMISFEKPNVKAFHETIHYFLHERVIKQNKEIKHVIITNIYNWFIFDATEFEKYFYTNKSFRNSYQEWHDKKLLGNTTDWFYNEIAKPFVESEIEKLDCVFINLLEYEQILRSENVEYDSKLINLYKIFSPAHLLKLSFANDYNKIDLGFYNELLYILGLEETKDGGKKIIKRAKERNRKEASLIENAIGIIEQRHRLKNLERLDLFGNTYDEQIFSVSLELCITWLNRILFLKLLEAQLIKYHKGNSEFSFLNSNRIKDFKELDELFFQVLAKKPENRSISANQRFGNLPYLNSSLFEETELEEKIIFALNLNDRLSLPLYPQSVLKQSDKFLICSGLNTLEYIFEFLNAYNFSSDQKAEIQNDNRTIINAAVLGLIFEKINGYQDGSFYTPSFITTFITREILKSTIVQKFRNSNLPDFKNLADFEDLKDRIGFREKDARRKANEIINSIKICDPAVGSGHFLVSALNEMIAIKNELRILQLPDGKRISGIKISNNNDELEIIVESTSEAFQYSVNDKHLPITELQELQEALFNEKRTLIEKCLFGVDINPKSVLICRLRLWIELLKSSFYTKQSNFQYLETLPNIDINIVAGNSLISKFDKNLNIFEKIKVDILIKDYKKFTEDYKNETDFSNKIFLRKSLAKIREQLETFAIPKDKLYKEYLSKNKEFELIKNMNWSNNQAAEKMVEINSQLIELERKYLEKQNYVYSNCLEWAFEFPEILTDNGEFVGFDVIVGNPPYFSISNEPKLKEVNENYTIYKQTSDIYTLFIERGLQILQPEGRLGFITSNKWLRAAYGESLREFLLKNTTIEKLIDFDGLKVFDEATVDTSIIQLLKHKNGKQTVDAVRFDKTFDLEKDSISEYFEKNKIELKNLTKESWNLKSEKENLLKQKLEKIGKPLKDWDVTIHYGIKTGFDKAFFIDKQTKEKLILLDKKNEKIIEPLLRGRDVHNYFIDKRDRYLINTYNGKLITEYDPNTEKNYRVRVDRVEVVKDYPVIYDYLKQFETELKTREDQGEHWTNHRNCAYQHLFYLEKIVYPETTGRRSEFYLDTEKYLLNKTCFMISGDNLRYLLGVLNSKIAKFYLEIEAQKIGKSAIQNSKIYVEKIPIPDITDDNLIIVSKIENIVNEIVTKKQTDVLSEISQETAKIDKLVYELYKLSPEEISMIEK